MGSTFQSPSVLSFCPGILGLERGFERAVGPCRIVCHVEIESFIIANLVAQMECGLVAPCPIWTDVKTFCPQHFRGKVHWIIGGYPCQPFSIAGKQRGIEDDRHLFPFIFRSIEAIRPLGCFFENVRGHLNMGYDEVYRSLRSIGYSVECGIYSAEEVGAPHERDRLFILALADTYKLQSAGEFRDFSSKAKEIEGTKWQQNGQRVWAEPVNSSEYVDYSLCDRFKQGYPISAGGNGAVHAGEDVGDTSGKGLEGQRAITRETAYPERGIASRFPARPGEQQYAWESKRVAKSGLGIRINGYNFREDLLRAAGNSVVEQTAEVAFIDLLKKHFDGRNSR